MTARTDTDHLLVETLGAFLGVLPIDAIHRELLRQRATFAGLPERLLPMLKDRLAKGVVYEIARRGARRERFLRADAGAARDRAGIASGRLWQRHGPESLRCEFTEHTAAFLAWCVSASSTDRTSDVPTRETPLSAADAFLRFLAYAATRQTPAGRAWRVKPAFRNHWFCRTVFAADFELDKDLPDGAGAGGLPEPWFAPTFLPIWEALQEDLRDQWRVCEETKSRLTDAGEMLRLGQAQGRAWDRFAASLVEHERRDLARFALDVARHELLEQDRRDWEDWCGRLKPAGRNLVERAEVYRAACVIPRIVREMEAWTQQAASVGYVDEHYAAAQLWKSEWERYEGPRLARRARNLLATIDRVAGRRP